MGRRGRRWRGCSLDVSWREFFAAVANHSYDDGPSVHSLCGRYQSAFLAVEPDWHGAEELGKPSQREREDDYFRHSAVADYQYVGQCLAAGGPLFRGGGEGEPHCMC